MQLAERVTALDAGLGRDVDQRLLFAARSKMAVYRVMADVGPATDEPSGERRLRIIENCVKRRLPLDRRCVLAPERFAVSERPAVDFLVGTHRALLCRQARCSTVN